MTSLDQNRRIDSQLLLRRGDHRRAISAECEGRVLVQVPQAHPEIGPVGGLVVEHRQGLRQAVRWQGEVDVVPDGGHEGVRHGVLVGLHVRRSHQEASPARLDVLDDLEVVAGRQVDHQVPGGPGKD